MYEFAPVAVICVEPPGQTVIEVALTPTTGGVFTEMAFVVVIDSVPKLFVTVNETSYVPDIGYVTTGFGLVEVAGLPPGKDQFQLVIFAVDKSLNVIDPPSQTEVASDV